MTSRLDEKELKEIIKDYLEDCCIANVYIEDILNENCHTKVCIKIVNKYFPNIEYRYFLDLTKMLLAKGEMRIKILNNILTDYKQTLMKYFFYRRI